MATANQQYKTYKRTGGTKPFGQWIDDEKKKKFKNFSGIATVPTNKPLNDSIQNTLDRIHKQAGFQDQVSDTYWLGVNKKVFIVAGIIGVGLVAVYLYNKNKKG